MGKLKSLILVSQLNCKIQLQCAALLSELLNICRQRESKINLIIIQAIFGALASRYWNAPLDSTQFISIITVSKWLRWVVFVNFHFLCLSHSHHRSSFVNTGYSRLWNPNITFRKVFPWVVRFCTSVSIPRPWEAPTWGGFAGSPMASEIWGHFTWSVSWNSSWLDS